MYPTNRPATLTQGATVNVLQSLAVSKVKEIADSLKNGAEETEESETVRAALQGLCWVLPVLPSIVGTTSISASVKQHYMVDVVCYGGLSQSPIFQRFLEGFWAGGILCGWVGLASH